MDRRFHIIITGEQGKARTFAISKAALKKLLAAAAVLFTIVMFIGITYSIERFNLKKIDHLENNVANLSDTNRTLQEQQDNQLSGVYGELNRRSQVVGSILSTLDIPTPPPPATGKDSGGPFSRLGDRPYDQLLSKVDRELELLRPLPLGYPVLATAVSSGFGSRQDPVNGAESFHDGIDLRGSYGAMVKATADGKVVEEGYNDDYGRYLLIGHANGFTTLYAHNQKVLVTQGDRVARGQTISLLGSTGRSTGPHLHYEIRRHNRPVNPNKFLNIARLLADNSA